MPYSRTVENSSDSFLNSSTSSGTLTEIPLKSSPTIFKAKVTVTSFPSFVNVTEQFSIVPNASFISTSAGNDFGLKNTPLSNELSIISNGTLWLPALIENISFLAFHFTFVSASLSTLNLPFSKRLSVIANLPYSLLARDLFSPLSGTKEI